MLRYTETDFDSIIIVPDRRVLDRQLQDTLKQIEGDNSESNKRYKFDEVFDAILLDFVNSKLDLYKKLSQPEIKADLKRHLYRAYLDQS